MSPYRQYHVLDPRHHYGHAVYTLGRRGAFLALLGVVWIMQGVLLATTLPDNPDYPLMSSLGPLPALGWIATGGTALVFSLARQGHDGVGFVALYTMAMWRALAYGHGFLLWLLPGGASGDPRGIVAALGWIVIIGATVIVAGWRENPEAEPGDAGEGGDP